MAEGESLRADLEPTGPFVAAAFLCEKVLIDQDGVPSTIRIVDRVTHVSSGPTAADEMPPITVTLTAFIMLKAGSALGRHMLKLRIEEPSGIRSELGSNSVEFEAPDRGVQVVVNLNLQVSLDGLYWIDVLLDGRLLTRIPLRVIYQAVRTGQM